MLLNAGIIAASAGGDPILTTANLHTYYNANFGVLQTTGGSASVNGDPVGFWDARGATAIDASQFTSTARPTLTTLNSKPSLSFDGGDFFTAGSTSNWNAFNGSGGFTIVAVFQKAISDPNAAMIIVDTCGAASVNTGFSLFYDDRSVSAYKDALRLYISMGTTWVANAWTPNNILTGTNPYLIVATYNGTSNTVGAQISSVAFRVNGVNVAIASNTSFAAPSSSNSTFPLTIGKLASSSGFLLNGHLPLLAMFSGVVPLADIQAIETYWMAEYGIT